jgi:hypothetical protein
MKIIPEEFKNRPKTRPMVGYLCEVIPYVYHNSYGQKIVVWPNNMKSSATVLVVKMRVKGRYSGRSMCLVLHPELGLIQIGKEYLVPVN